MSCGLSADIAMAWGNSVSSDGDLGQTCAMTTALGLLAIDRFELSLQFTGAVPHFPALDLVKGLADPLAHVAHPFALCPGDAPAGARYLPIGMLGHFSKLIS